MRVVVVEAVAEHRVREGSARGGNVCAIADHRRLRIPPKLRHGRAAFGRDAERARSESAAERVEHVELGRLDHFGRDRRRTRATSQKLAMRSAAVVMMSSSYRPFGVRARERVADLVRPAPVGHERPVELDHDLATLVDAPAPHRDDADARVRLRLAHGHDLALCPQRVADEHRLGQLDVAPAEIGGRVLAGVGHGEADDERERERAVHERLTELRPLRVRHVEVDLVRVQRQAGEPDVVRVRDRAAEAAAEHVTDIEVLVEPAAPLLRRLDCISWHRQGSFPRARAPVAHALPRAGRSSRRRGQSRLLPRALHARRPRPRGVLS